MSENDLSRGEWRKSSYSGQSGNCVLGLSGSGSRLTAKLSPSLVDRGSDMSPGLAPTCPQACPVPSGGLPAEPWTGPTPTSS